MNVNQTLKLNKEFRRLYYRGKCVPCRNVVVYVGKNRLHRTRLGLTCGKSVGKAVARNRAKRLMRESFRTLLPQISGSYDVVIVARTGINGKKCAEVLRDVKYAFSKLGMLG